MSAYLKLRGDGPSFLLESAEQGQRFGRWSFLGFRPRTVLRVDDGVLTANGEQRAYGDPYDAVSEELERYRIAPLEGLPPFAGGAVGLFGYDLVRHAEPTVGERQPRRAGHARHGADGVRRARGLRPPAPRGHDPGQRVRRRRPRPRARGRRGRDRRGARAAGRAGAAGAARARARCPRSRATWARTATPRRSSGARTTSARATSTRWCPASAGAPTPRSRRSRSTAGCARSTRRPTCTSSTSRTSRSPAPRPSRW